MIWTRDNLSSATEFQKTQIDWVLASARFSDEDRAASYNAEKIKDYLNRFSQYKKAKDEHPELNNPAAPLPSLAWIVQTSAGGWSELVLGTQFVCPVITYIPPEHPLLTEGLIGSRLYPDLEEYANYFGCLPGDITPNRKIIRDAVSSDGISGNFVKYAYTSGSPGHEIPGIFIKQ